MRYRVSIKLVDFLAERAVVGREELFYEFEVMWADAVGAITGRTTGNAGVAKRVGRKSIDCTENGQGDDVASVFKAWRRFINNVLDLQKHGFSQNYAEV